MKDITTSEDRKDGGQVSK